MPVCFMYACRPLYLALVLILFITSAAVFDCRNSYADENLLNLTDEEISDLALAYALNEESGKLLEAGDPSQALPVAKRALELFMKVLGADHVDTGKAAANLAYVLHLLGDLEGAQQHYKRALDILEGFGPSGETAALSGLLGDILRAQGDTASAITYYEKRLKIYEQAYGEKDLNTGMAADALGSIHYWRGELERAKPYVERVMNIYKTVLGADHPDTALSMQHLGILLFEMDDPGPAKEYLLQALRVYQGVPGPRRPDMMPVLDTLITIYEMEGDLEKARIYMEQAVAYTEKSLGVNQMETAAIVNNLGLLLLKMKDAAAAQSALERAVEIAENIDAQGLQTADIIRNLAQLHYNEGDFQRAGDLFEKVLDIRESSTQSGHKDMVITLTNLGIININLGELKAAGDYLHRALDSAKTADDPENEVTAGILDAIGVLNLKDGDFPRAKHHLEEALRIRKKLFGDNHLETATSLNYMGVLYYDTGELAQARLYFEQVLAIYESSGGVSGKHKFEVLNALGVLLTEISDLEGARLRLQEALLVGEKEFGPKHAYTAAVMNNLGDVLHKTGDLTGAQDYFERALAIRVEVFGAENPETAISLNHLGILHKDLGNLEDAKLFYERALAIREKHLGPKHPDTAISRDNLGLLLRDMGDRKAAKVHMEKALEAFEEILGPNHYDTITSQVNLSNLLWASGDIEGAIALRERALYGEENVLNAVLAVGTQQKRLEYLRSFTGRANGNVSLHVDAAPASTRAARLSLNTILQRKGRALDASVAGLRDMLKKDDNPGVRKAIEDVKRLREQLAYLVLRPPEGHLVQQATMHSKPGGGYELVMSEESKKLDEYHARVAALKGDLEDAEERLQLSAAGMEVRHPPVNVGTVQSKLPKETALIEFFFYRPVDMNQPDPAKRLGEPHYVAYVLKSSGHSGLYPLGKAAAIDGAVEKLRVSIQGRHNDVLDHAHGLYKMILGNILPLPGNPGMLIISPDGALNLIPFAALVDDSETFLVEKYSISYLASGRDLVRAPARGASAEPLLVGDVDFDAALTSHEAGDDTDRPSGMRVFSLNPLAETRKEVDAIAALLGVSEERVLAGKRATESKIKRIKSPKIVHLATHGFFLPEDPPLLDLKVVDGEPAVTVGITPLPLKDTLEDPLLRSGLALSGFNRRSKATTSDDGMLTALEVAGLDLWGTEIVVLSACETGVGEVSVGEGVFGLRRALVLAGSQSQVMTLWQVADEPTKDLMISWYRQLMKGAGRAEALQAAQVAAVQGRNMPGTGKPLTSRGTRPVDKTGKPADPRIAGTRHPYFWAGFILSGATGPVKSMVKN